MVKALPCPHVHAGSALVHQAEQAHPLHARSGGSGGNCRQPGAAGRASAAPHVRPGWPGLSQYQQLARTCARAMILYAFC